MKSSIIHSINHNLYSLNNSIFFVQLIYLTPFIRNAYTKYYTNNCLMTNVMSELLEVPVEICSSSNDLKVIKKDSVYKVIQKPIRS